MIAFGSAPGDDGGWCWDASSCAARARRYPNATSSAAWPTTFTRDGDASFTDTGVFSKSGEGNPNFYNSHNALVPSCSSDLFVGRAHNFRGRAIALGAMMDGCAVGARTTAAALQAAANMEAAESRSRST